VGVRVEPGQEVEAGELLCLLEAMKMENELASPRATSVKEVLVREGDSVESGQVLITLE
jgi:acetyl-CoA/propionyl-CoA carboxylase biotin carboxyl carrier protein